MRQTYCAEVRFLNRKRYYKSVGLPYSSIQFGSVFCKTDFIDRDTYYGAIVRYTKKIHDLSLSVGQYIEFEALAEISNEGEKVYFKNPRNIKIVEV